MDSFTGVAFEVQAFLSQVFSVFINFVVYNFQLIFCRSLTISDLIRIPSSVSQIVNSTRTTIDSHLTGVDSAVCTIDIYSISTFASSNDTCCTIEMNGCTTGAQCHCVFQVYSVCFSFCKIVDFFFNMDVLATFYLSIGRSFYFVQLFKVNSITIFCTSFNIFDLRIVSIEAVVCNKCITTNSQAIVVDCCLTSCYAVQAC